MHLFSNECCVHHDMMQVLIFVKFLLSVSFQVCCGRALLRKSNVCNSESASGSSREMNILRKAALITGECTTKIRQFFQFSGVVWHLMTWHLMAPTLPVLPEASNLANTRNPCVKVICMCWELTSACVHSERPHLFPMDLGTL